MDAPAPPYHGFIFLSPEKPALRVARLFEYLKGIPNPLHTEIRRSPFAPLIPQEWFLISEPRAFPQQSRHFARRMLLWGPALVASFVRADWPALLQIPAIEMYIVCCFFSHEYALEAAEAATKAKMRTVPL